MSGRFIRSCILNGVVDAGLGLAATYWLHMIAGHLTASGQIIWQRGEPQYLGVCLTYGALGALWRYVTIEVFGQTMRGYAALPATSTNTYYRPAIIAEAFKWCLMLLVYKLFFLDIQAAAADPHGNSIFTLQELLGPVIFNGLSKELGGWLGLWPYNFYAVLGLAALLGSFVGFCRRADEHNHYLPLVVGMRALRLALYGLSGVLIVIFCLFKLPPGAPSLPWRRPFGPPGNGVGFLLFAVPLGLAIYAAYGRLSAQGRETRPASLYEPAPSLTARLETLFQVSHVAGRTVGDMFSIVLKLAILAGVWWCCHWELINYPGGDLVWYTIGIGTTLVIGWKVLKTAGELWLFLMPTPAPDLPPSDLHGSPHGPTEDDIRRAMS